MNVKVNDFILFKLENNDIFDRSSDFTIAFDKLCIVRGKSSETPTLNVTGMGFLRYVKATPTEQSKLQVGTIRIIFGDRIQYRVLETFRFSSAEDYRKLYVQGKVVAITPDSTPSHSISIDQAHLVNLGERYIDIGNDAEDIVNGKVIYKNEEIDERWITIFSTDLTNVELNLKADKGYMTARAKIKLQLDAEILGFGTGKVNVPYTTKAGKITIPACCIFEDNDDADTPNLLSIEFQEGTDTNYYCYLNDKQVLIKDGFTIKEEMNETLDSGVVLFTGKMANIDIEQYDTFSIECSNMNFARRKMLVNVFDTSVVEYDDDDILNSESEYTVNLFSETKMLERIPLPNLVIRRRASNPKTVYQKVLEYCQMYLPRIMVMKNGSLSKECCLKIDPTLEDLLDIECPEFSWNNPTLREVLTDLFSVRNLIPIVKDNILTYFNLEQKGNEIDMQYITDFKYEGVSADYCGELFIPVQNVIQSGVTRICEYSSVKTDGERFTNDNTSFVTSKPIHRIISVKVYAKIKDTYHSNNNTYLKITDITDRVIEKTQYDALSPQNKGFNRHDKIVDFNLFYLYFVKGERNIRHVADSTEFYWTLGSGGNWSKINLIIASKMARDESQHSSDEVYNVRPNLFRIPDGAETEVFVKIEYEALDETTLSIGRDKQLRNKGNKLFDGQSNSIVDIKKQIEQEYSKVNRYGSRILNIFGSYYNEDDVPQLGDRIGNKILYSRELQYYDNVIIFHGKLCENYVLKNYFTSIQNEKRIFQLVSNNDATTRHDNMKMYVACCLEKDTSNADKRIFSNGVYELYFVTGSNHYGSKFCKSLANSFKTEYNKFVLKHCAFQNNETKSAYGNSIVFEQDTNYSIAGRSFIIDFGFVDNVVVGNGVSVDDDGNKYAVPYKYVDANGEFTNIFIRIANEYNAGDGQFNFEDYINALDNVVSTDDFDNDKYNTVVNKTREKPKINEGGFNDNNAEIFCSYLHYYKDNGERIKYTIQLEIMSGSEEVFVKDLFMETLRYFTTTTKAYKIYVTQNDQYEVSDVDAKGTLRDDLSLTMPNSTVAGDWIELTGDVTLTNNDCWCVADSNGKIVLAVNGNNKKVYFELRAFEDVNVYNDIIDKVKIGISHDSNETLSESYAQNLPEIASIKVMGRTILATDTKFIDDALDEYIS